MTSAVLIRGFVDPTELAEIVEWFDTTDHLKIAPNLQGRTYPRKNRKTTRMVAGVKFPGKVYEIKDRIIERFGITTGPQWSATRGGIFAETTGNTEGEDALPEHLDVLDSMTAKHVMTYNVMVQRAETGGLFRIGGEEYDLDPGDLIAFPASEIKHSVSPIGGDTFRHILLYRFIK